VVKLIHGKGEGQERIWEFELISNKITGIDVDKLDYFRRDAYYLGAKGIHINQELLMNESRIIDNQICYPTKYI
jgi:HD superfamily phosphohydrolase